MAAHSVKGARLDESVQLAPVTREDGVLCTDDASYFVLCH